MGSRKRSDCSPNTCGAYKRALAPPSAAASTRVLYVEPNFQETPSEYDIFYDCFSSEGDYPTGHSCRQMSLHHQLSNDSSQRAYDSQSSTYCRPNLNKLVRSCGDGKHLRTSLQQVACTARILLKSFEEGSRKRSQHKKKCTCNEMHTVAAPAQAMPIHMAADFNSGDSTAEAKELHLDPYTIRIEPVSLSIPLRIEVRAYPATAEATSVTTLVADPLPMHNHSRRKMYEPEGVSNSMEPIRTAIIAAAGPSSCAPIASEAELQQPPSATSASTNAAPQTAAFSAMPLQPGAAAPPAPVPKTEFENDTASEPQRTHMLFATAAATVHALVTTEPKVPPVSAPESTVKLAPSVSASASTITLAPSMPLLKMQGAATSTVPESSATEPAPLLTATSVPSASPILSTTLMQRAVESSVNECYDACLPTCKDECGAMKVLCPSTDDKGTQVKTIGGHCTSQIIRTPEPSLAVSDKADCICMPATLANAPRKPQQAAVVTTVANKTRDEGQPKPECQLDEAAGCSQTPPEPAASPRQTPKPSPKPSPAPSPSPSNLVPPTGAARKVYRLAHPQHKQLKDICQPCRYDPSPLIDDKGKVICPFNCGCCLCPWKPRLTDSGLHRRQHEKIKVCRCRNRGTLFKPFDANLADCSNDSFFDVCPCREKAEAKHLQLYGMEMWKMKEQPVRTVDLSDVVEIRPKPAAKPLKRKK